MWIVGTEFESEMMTGDWFTIYILKIISRGENTIKWINDRRYNNKIISRGENTIKWINDRR